MPMLVASCLATSVLPTPVGPMKRKEPMGWSGAASPARDLLMAVVRVSMAVSWPKITLSSLPGKDSREDLSAAVTLETGTLAILATIFSISLGLTVLRRPSAVSFKKAPASSITSMALSGNNRSLMYLSDR